MERVSKEISKDKGHNIYYILLILTDGEIHDMRETIDKIVEANHLPLSVIIIGIGEDEKKFSNMVYLDCDDDLLWSSDGK